ncbi:hypothetical protein ACNVED_12760 [Legionella sp. D16C41]|uniref:hypothetical protein n=1 Tax=Legionella sp. D16C41 TaxID=3402688 RepID=UPI003AF79118
MKIIMSLLLLGLSNIASAIAGNSLFLLTSSEATIAPLHKNNYILNLSQPVKYISYYTQTPNGVAGAALFPLENFISLWRNQTVKNNFSNNPPQALLATVNEEGEGQKTVLVIVTNPSMVNGTLSYQVSVLNGESLITGKLKFVTLIFDKIADDNTFLNALSVNSN